jgi:hypothetical protein
MNALTSFNRQQDQDTLDDFFAAFAAPDSAHLPRVVLSALSRTGSGQIIRGSGAQLWLTQEYGINPGRDTNRHEVGAAFVDYDWSLMQWRAIGGAA